MLTSVTVADGDSGMSAASAKVTTVGGDLSAARGAASTKVMAVGGGLDAATARERKSSSHLVFPQSNPLVCSEGEAPIALVMASP